MVFIRASFAVVGHPNKGKSSIVSTLARNDSVAISRRSGTTTHSNYYKIDTGKAGFELIDTPGFQRPQKVLHWLQQRSQSADQRIHAVKQFIQSETCKTAFPDEVELLTPIVKGAAILYVVDGSRPYGKEYEMEMEILRWTGRPSMALINPIESSEYVASWQAALGQFFKIVRVFNPLHADQSQQLDLLEAFAHLEPQWRVSIQQVMQDLQLQQQKLVTSSAHILAELLVDLCSYRVQQKVFTKSQAEQLKDLTNSRFQNWMSRREHKAYQQLAQHYAHFDSEIEVDGLALPPDLFDSEKWFAWGLSKKELASVSLLAGAASGGVIDAMLAGHSFLLGSVIGGALGASSAWFGADKISEFKVKGIPLGGYNATQGPISNPNFPYVVIARFIFIFEQIKNKNHANRQVISLMKDQASENKLEIKLSKLNKTERKQLHTACNNLCAQKPVELLAETLKKLLL